jgi:hypothetical protein
MTDKPMPTDAMIEAGVEVLWRLADTDESPGDMKRSAEAIYRAMQAARPPLSDDKLSGLVERLDKRADVMDGDPRAAAWVADIRAVRPAIKALQQQLRVKDELWAKFAENIGLEISWGELDNDPSECGWRVHARFGGVNDREWNLVATGSTPLEAIRKALSAPEGSDR